MFFMSYKEYVSMKKRTYIHPVGLQILILWQSTIEKNNKWS